MTQADTIRTLRAALQPFAEAWEETRPHKPVVTVMCSADSLLCDSIWEQALQVYRDTAHATTPQEPRTQDAHAQQVIDMLNAMCEHMRQRKAKLDELIAESGRIIDTYNREAGQ